MGTKVLTAKEVMRPHRKNEEHVYVRVRKDILNGCYTAPGSSTPFSYCDFPAGRRIISASRAEAAVELTDFIRVCKEENLDIIINPSGMYIISDINDVQGVGDSIRTAYFQYKLSAGLGA